MKKAYISFEALGENLIVDLFPWCRVLVGVDSGYWCFESQQDADKWEKQR